MTLKELVQKAYSECPTFKAKYDWRVVQRNKRGDEDLPWLMARLEDALGRDFVEAAARAYMEAQGGKEEDAKSPNSSNP